MITDYKWKVVPLCERQLRDVNSHDILENGLFRKCNVYKGGGGYDMFPKITMSRLGKKFHNQFVVQLYGCPFSCKYCYVTKDGVFGKYIRKSTKELMDSFKKSGQDVFHLMGGAPAMYVDHWKEIMDNMPPGKIFTSDIMLLDNETMWKNKRIMGELSTDNSIFAVSIKGTNSNEFYENTNQQTVCFDEEKIFNRIYMLMENKVNFYITFTGCEQSGVNMFKDKMTEKGMKFALNDCFSIDIINYNAINPNDKKMEARV